MFTGIVEELGEVVAVTDLADARRLTFRGPRVTSDASYGQSIAVNGCCLTVVALDGDTFTCDVMRESLDRTSLRDVRVGTHVNLERAVRADERLGGHIVAGHVDGTGIIVARTTSDNWDVVAIAIPRELARYVVLKGSIAVDGVSLTVSGLDDQQPAFEVSLIPATLAGTTLGFTRIGDTVNIEVDVLAKYVERLLAARPSESPTSS